MKALTATTVTVTASLNNSPLPSRRPRLPSAGPGGTATSGTDYTGDQRFHGDDPWQGQTSGTADACPSTRAGTTWRRVDETVILTGSVSRG